MQNTFIGFYPEQIDNNKKFLNESLIVLDVESLLYFYRLDSKCSRAMKEILEKLKLRLWLPYDIAWFYHQRMNDEIVNQTNNINSSLSSLLKCKKYITSNDEYPFIQESLTDELDNFIRKFNSECEREISQLNNILVGGGIKQEICSLYKDKIGDPYIDTQLDTLYKEGDNRYKSKIPPGYLSTDNNKRVRYHDFVVWKQLQAYCSGGKHDILYVTGHIRDDYYYIVNKKVVSTRNELVNEFRTKTKSIFNCMGIYDFFVMCKEELSITVENIDYLLDNLEDIQKSSYNDRNVISNQNNNSVNSSLNNDSQTTTR